jgi:hypothetical protein
VIVFVVLSFLFLFFVNTSINKKTRKETVVSQSIMIKYAINIMHCYAVE